MHRVVGLAGYIVYWQPAMFCVRVQRCLAVTRTIQNHLQTQGCNKWQEGRTWWVCFVYYVKVCAGKVIQHSLFQPADAANVRNSTENSDALGGGGGVGAPLIIRPRSSRKLSSSRPWKTGRYRWPGSLTPKTSFPRHEPSQQAGWWRRLLWSPQRGIKRAEAGKPVSSGWERRERIQVLRTYQYTRGQAWFWNQPSKNITGALFPCYCIRA